MSREFGLPLLGKIAIDLEIGKGGDSGIPLMVSAPDSEVGRNFRLMAERIVEVTGHGMQHSDRAPIPSSGR